MRALRAVAHICAVFLFCGSLAWAGADEEYQRAVKLYRKGDYAGAIKGFEAAARLRPSPKLEYNIGRCHEKLGHAEKAVFHYKRYLELQPGADNRLDVEDRIVKLEAVSTPPSTPAPTSQPAAKPAATTRPTTRPRNDLTDPFERRGPVHEAESAVARYPNKPSSSPPGSPESSARPPVPSKKVAPAPPSRPAPSKDPGDSTPIYKKWWFWAACVGAAVIAGVVIGTAATKSESRPPGQTKGLQWQRQHDSVGLGFSF